MSVFVLKIIAMITMAVDHVGFQLMNNNLFMRLIGRTAFMVYAFLMAEGYYHLKDAPDRLAKHVGKLVLLCLVTEVPFDLFEFREWVNFQTQSVLPTLLLGFAALIVSGWWMAWVAPDGTGRQMKCAEPDGMTAAGTADGWRKVIGIAGCVVICLAAAAAARVIRSEYSFAGVLLIVLFYLCMEKTGEKPFPERALALAGVYAAYLVIYIWQRSGFGGWQEFAAMAWNYRLWFSATGLTIIPLLFYNRQLGYHSRWFDALYSCFYPLQFVVIIVIRTLLEHS